MPQHLIHIVFLFALGACLGSFLNVVVWRLPRIEGPVDESLARSLWRTFQGLAYPPSHCPKCNTKLAWYDNIPVFGWIALAAALLNLVRPSIVLMSVALAAAGFGLVMHNAGLSGLAVALLILSLARPAPAPARPVRDSGRACRRPRSGRVGGPRGGGPAPAGDAPRGRSRGHPARRRPRRPPPLNAGGSRDHRIVAACIGVFARVCGNNSMITDEGGPAGQERGSSRSASAAVMSSSRTKSKAPSLKKLQFW